jgi:hypothetical protein
LAAAGASPCALVAQYTSARAAWDALTLSPVGALAPLASYPVDDDSRQTNVWLRYGRWRFDGNDAVHNNIGLTVVRQLPFQTSELSVTAAYLSLSCPTCPAWVSGGASLQSTLWQHGSSDERSGRIGLRADVGAAHYRGTSQTNAASAAGAVVVGFGLPVTGESHLSATVSPGIGAGRIALADGIHSGARRIVGASLAWIHSSGLAVNVGMQRIVIRGGPTQLGAGLGWGRE